MAVGGAASRLVVLVVESKLRGDGEILFHAQNISFRISISSVSRSWDLRRSSFPTFSSSISLPPFPPRRERVLLVLLLVAPEQFIICWSWCTAMQIVVPLSWYFFKSYANWSWGPSGSGGRGREDFRSKLVWWWRRQRAIFISRFSSSSLYHPPPPSYACTSFPLV